MNGHTLFKIAGVCCLALAVFHLVVIFIGAPAYRYFGAGETMAQMDEAGSLVPALGTLVIVAVFIGFAAYAFSGAEMIRPLPLLKLGTYAIGVVFSLRGIAVFFQVRQLMQSPDALPLREPFFSLVSLIIGLMFIIGARYDPNRSRVS